MGSSLTLELDFCFHIYCPGLLAYFFVKLAGFSHMARFKNFLQVMLSVCIYPPLPIVNWKNRLNTNIQNCLLPTNNYVLPHCGSVRRLSL